MKNIKLGLIFGFGFALLDVLLPSWMKGLFVGILLSFSDAIIANTYAPIIGIGALGGLIIGFLSKKYETITC